MENNKAFNLKELLSNDRYVIPIYQRNYAWGKAEVSQLIQDIHQFFELNSDKSYYIGSLVCFKRENGDFELIDGQQRHTTISLINAVLKSWQPKVNNTVSSTNLKFDSRKNTQLFLEELYLASNSESFLETNNILGTQSFKDAIGFIKEEFNERDFNIAKFANNFYNKVKFFRVEVPQNTDLNHYFEIINNRGEQLEKHEIVKAKLMGKIKNEDEEIEKQEQQTFANIWDACSDMSDYVYFKFSNTNQKNDNNEIPVSSRKKIFTDEGNLKIKDFDSISINDSEDNREKMPLAEIICKHNIPTDFSQEEKKLKERYKSVIDFPNFLLQVLKLKYETVSLDDKNLLKAFSENEVDSKEFIFNLLKYRVVFDKYIIKQDLSNADEEKQSWSIRKLNNQYDGVARTYKENYEELIKLQTMLYYSNPSNINNNWVQKILKEEYYFKKDVTEFSEKIFSEIVKPRFDETKLIYPDITAYNLFFIDFLLWKFWKEETVEDKDIKGVNEDNMLTNEDKKDNLKARMHKIVKIEGKENYQNLFQNFTFKQLNSKEHLLP